MTLSTPRYFCFLIASITRPVILDPVYLFTAGLAPILRRHVKFCGTPGKTDVWPSDLVELLLSAFEDYPATPYLIYSSRNPTFMQPAIVYIISVKNFTVP